MLAQAAIPSVTRARAISSPFSGVGAVIKMTMAADWFMAPIFTVCMRKYQEKY
jgi:hypothetical protein